MNPNGQVTLETEFGRYLKSLTANPKYKTVFEVGTWKGNGTTRCLVEGCIERFKSHPERTIHLWSLESNLNFYSEAMNFWLQVPLPFLHLLYGRLHREGLMTEEEIRAHPRFNHIVSHFNLWYKQDVLDYNQAPVLDMALFPDIDVVVLDGGEFSSSADWTALKQKNPKVVCLDDVGVMKNYDVFAELCQSNEWKHIAGNEERHGWAVFERVE
jgi:hypothetical protein